MSGARTIPGGIASVSCNARLPMSDSRSAINWRAKRLVYPIPISQVGGLNRPKTHRIFQRTWTIVALFLTRGEIVLNDLNV